MGETQRESIRLYQPRKRQPRIAAIGGDGIGPEIVEQAVLILNRVAEIYGHSFRYTDVDMGGAIQST